MLVKVILSRIVLEALKDKAFGGATRHP